MNPEIQALLDRFEELTDEELTELETFLQVEIDRLAETEISDEVLVELEEVVAAHGRVREEMSSREAAATTAEERRQALLSQVRSDPDPDPDPQDPPADPEPTPDPEPQEPAAGEGEPAQPQAVAASARMPRVPSTRAPRVQSVREPRYALTASGEAGVASSTPLTTLDAIRDVFSTRGRAAIQSDGYYPVLHAESENWPAERDLRGLSAIEVSRRIAAVMSPEAIQAAGGLCEPMPPRYDLISIGDTNRPVQAANPTFRADRGGVQYVVSPTLADVVVSDSDLEAAIRRITKEEDADLDTEKPCQVVTCNDVNDAFVYAITKCLEVGNWQYTFFREQFTQFWDLVGVAYARHAEQLLLAAMEADSLAVTATKVLGTARDVLDNLAQIAIPVRGQYREMGLSMKFIAPFWLREQMKADFRRQAPGDDVMRTTDAEIDSAIRAVGFEPVWSPDYQLYGQPLGAGQVPGWRKTVDTLVYLEGTWFNLDGGEIDFGLVRDSTLNKRNALQVMSEGFEGIARFGLASYKYTMAICPDGTTSAPVDIDPCAGTFGS